MESRRFAALQQVAKRTPVEPIAPNGQISAYYGSNVFGHDAMKEFLSEEAFSMVQNAIEKGTSIDRKIADQVASAMKNWAAGKGATHYTHWFQPLNGTTAEKHDGFFEPSEKSYIELAKYKVAETEVYAHPIIAGDKIYVKDKTMLTCWSLK